jgi:adenylate cyclase
VLQLRAWQRFHLRITALFAAVVFVVITVAAAVSYQVATTQTQAALAHEMEVLASTYANGIDARDVMASRDDLAHPVRQELRHWFARVQDDRVSTIYVLLYDADPSKLVFFVDWARDQEEGAPGELYDATGMQEMQLGFHQTVHEAEMVEDAWGLTFSAYSPILGPDGQPYALVGVDVQAADVRALQRQVLWITFLAWLVGAATVAAASWVVGRNVREPLNQVIDATARIAEGSFDTRLHSQRTDEFGLMANHFDRMAEGLAEREVIRETFGRYVAPHVARKLLADGAHLGGAQVDITVLFTDLRSYSTVSEALPPNQLIQLSNTYLGRMQEAIDAEEGTVIEFLGDAILAVFGAPTPQEDHPARAVRCALAMRTILDELNAEADASGLSELWKQAGVDRLAHRVGIHSGPAIAGNIGSATRMKYAVLGDTVNIAARLEQLNKEHGTDVLVSAETRSRLPVELQDALEPVGTVPVKGRVEPVEVYKA